MPLPRAKKSRIARPRQPKAAKWLKLTNKLEKLPGTWGDGEILNLPGWKTTRHKETADDFIVLAEVTTESTERCDCGKTWEEKTKWGYTDPTHVRDIPIRCKRTRIYFRLQRRRCEECKKTFQQPLIGINEQHTILTSRLVEYISHESFNIFRTFADIADEVGCSDIIVRQIQTDRAVELETDKVIEAPRWLGIDEVHPQKYGQDYCVLTAPEHRRVLDLLVNKDEDQKENRRKKNRKNQKVYRGIETTVLFKWILNLKNPGDVLVVTIDMSDQYRYIARWLLKNAAIVVDRYHVHNLLNVALKGVLKVLRANMTVTEQRRLMRRESLVLKNYRHLSDKKEKDEDGKEYPSEKELFSRWLDSVPDLKMAYWLKKDFSDILQLSDRQKAEELTDAWLDRVCEFVKYFRSKYREPYGRFWEDPFGNVPNTITDWRREILNYIEYKKFFKIKATNAFAEFANKQIKKAYQLSNSIRYEVLRVKVIHGGVLVVKRPPHPLDRKWTRSPSDRGARRGPKKREINPISNLMRLKSARVTQDKTRELFPEPQATPGWLERFGTTYLRIRVSPPPMTIWKCLKNSRRLKKRKSSAEAARISDTIPGSLKCSEEALPPELTRTVYPATLAENVKRQRFNEDAFTRLLLCVFMYARS